jgi:flavin-dependent dehydrogenase
MTGATHTAQLPLAGVAEVMVVGASFAGAACAKRLIDAGISTLVIEKQALPRHKICSGILAPRGYRFLLENFGPLPAEVLHQPVDCKGVTFHFPHAPSVPLDFLGGPTPHLHRKYSDHWAIRASGAEIHDRTSFIGLEQDGSGVTVRAKHDGREVRYRARHVVAADGPSSPVVRALYPQYPAMIPWFMVGQKFHKIESCPLDERYFHFWFHPGLGHYTWSHARDGRQIVGVGFEVGGNLDRAHRHVVGWLRDRHDVHLGPAEDQEGCVENFGPSLINRYVFGHGQVLVTGQAAGFLNMLAEGMSCALHSGAIAGESIIEARQRAKPVQDVYRRLIQSEVQHCTDQWNPWTILTGNPHEADVWGALGRLSWRERGAVVNDLMRFVRLYKPYNWGRQMLDQAWQRAVHGEYASARWL